MNEAELLFSEILDCSRLSLYLNKRTLLPKVKSSLVSSVLKRRIKGEPIQYILGKTEFMGLEFKVTPDVLIPRLETEILIETAIKYLSPNTYRLTPINILDLGTGSGCVAVSLAKLIKNAKITAVDISDKALSIAKENAELNNVSIDFIQSDLFHSYDLIPNTYDLIVSNPPYIPRAEIEKLAPEIQYEPRIALDGGEDGLDFYHRIFKESAPYLRENGFLILEIGFGQKTLLENILSSSKELKIVEFLKDYNDIDRVIVIKAR